MGGADQRRGRAGGPRQVVEPSGLLGASNGHGSRPGSGTRGASPAGEDVCAGGLRWGPRSRSPRLRAWGGDPVRGGGTLGPLRCLHNSCLPLGLVADLG